MPGPTTQEYQPLSQALQFQSQPQELPRLQLAPPEHQRQLPTQAQAKQQPDTKDQPPQSSALPTTERLDEVSTSISSSREVSPAVGVESSLQTSNGQKRKSSVFKGASSKKRKTDQAQEQVTDSPVQYGLGAQYAYPYAYPGVPPPLPVPAFHPPQVSNVTSDMSFNEFQWRLLNLCGEFYEAATELIRSTPHLVLSQAFQILDRGTGLDPISILNDARRTCDMLLTNPQALSAAAPPPAALPLPTLTSLAHLNSRSNTNSASAPAPTATVAPPSYYSSNPTPMMVEFNAKPKERAPTNVQGTWKEEEIQKLKALAEKYKTAVNSALAEEEEEEEEEASATEKKSESAEGESAPKPSKRPKTPETPDVDWDKVVEEFGDGRSRHQVLIKATYLGLKPSSSLPGKKLKKRKSLSNAPLPPPLTFSSAKSVPTGYNPPQPGNAQGSSVTSSAAPNTPTAAAPQSKPAITPVSAPTPDSHKTIMAPLPILPQHHPHPPTPYGQPGWYPHPQNPYYAYHQPMYYSPHPQSYGIQGYGMQPPPHGYYPPYPPLSGTEVPPPVQTKGKRKEVRTDDASTIVASTTPVPPPSLPPKAPLADGTLSTNAAPASTTPTALKLGDPPASGASTPQLTPSANTPTGAPSSGVLRRAPNNSLFTYTPLPHGTSGASTEQTKEA